MCLNLVQNKLLPPSINVDLRLTLAVFASRKSSTQTGYNSVTSCVNFFLSIFATREKQGQQYGCKYSLIIEKCSHSCSSIDYHSISLGFRKLYALNIISILTKRMMPNANSHKNHAQNCPPNILVDFSLTFPIFILPHSVGYPINCEWHAVSSHLTHS